MMARGHFSDKIKEIAPQLEYAGMVTSAAWIDLMMIRSRTWW
jgi:hypothetical protein